MATCPNKMISFKDICINDYKKSKYLLSSLTNKIEDFSLNLFSQLCSSLNSNHRIICCFYCDIEAELDIMIGMGTILIEHKLIHNCGCVGHIEDVVIDQKYRNMNIGKLLIENLVNIARNKEAYKVILNCSSDKKEFYKKCGFYESNNEMRMNII
tara:strand:+ start:77 stop:541 length:465 start_codon:yes stop_codon:yes gene_type:complete